MGSIDLPSIETVELTVTGAVGVITLNRPKALNALDQPMCLAIDAALKVWAKDDSIAAVLIRGAGDRAFCSGGDVRTVREDGIAWKHGQSEGRIVTDFFRDEYRVNRRIKTFPKPYLALIDGITMGGGVGLSVHGAYRIATERTLIAMPETGIGLFPDVGTSYVLPRLPGEIGTYLALTGARVKTADAFALGLATHVVSHENIVDLTGAITTDTRRFTDDIIADYAIDPGVPQLLPQRAVIDACFSFDRAEDILATLDADGGVFAIETAATIRAMSPTSVKLALKEMRRGRTLDFDNCLLMEYRLSQSVLAGRDFYEGVRAQLVDKDRKPKWHPAALDAVDDSAIDSRIIVSEGGTEGFDTTLG